MRIGYHRVLATASGAPLLDGTTGSLLSGQVLGGSGSEWMSDVVVDTAGAVYLGGQTSSPDFVTGAMMTGASGTTTTDGFVVKLSFPALTLTPSTRRIAYGYDELNRLTGATESGASTASYAYAYDRAGNRTGVTTNGVAQTFSFNTTDQVVGWSYDAVGNLLSDGTRTSTYDALGRMTSQTINGGDTLYRYNGDGVLVRDARGVVVNQYAQDLAAPLPQVLQINQDSVYYGLDRLATDIVPIYRQWYLHDALDSTRQTVQGGGTLNAGRYDPWGAPIDNQIAPFGFAGELQGDGGLVYLRARWYTPQQGVFTSRDPFAGFPEQPYSQHYFQYGYSNPVWYVDPSGLCVAPCVPTPGPVPSTPTTTPTGVPRGGPSAGQPPSGGGLVGGVVSRPPYTGDTIRLPQLPAAPQGAPRPPSGSGVRGGVGLVGVIAIVSLLADYCLSLLPESLPTGPAPVPGPVALPPEPSTPPTPNKQPQFLVHYTNKAAYDRIVPTQRMRTSSGPEGGYRNNIFFTETSPFAISTRLKGGLGYDPEIIAGIGLGIPRFADLGAAAAEYYVVVDSTRMPDCTWWTRQPAAKPEYNCSMPTGGDHLVPIVKHGRTEDLDQGKDSLP